MNLLSYCFKKKPIWKFYLLRGHLPKVSVEKKHKRVVLRFLRDVPAIIGADIETCGPFKVEDVVSLPFENSKILVKQGLTRRVEV